MWLPLLLLPCALALRTLEPPPPVSNSRNSPVEGWVDVRVNHFQAHNNDTFPMRYYYNNEFGSEGIVIFVGGEWAISPGWVQAGLGHELASMLGAAIFYTEHRYYGATRPTQDTNVSDLRYLTVDQALGDLAQFIQYIKSDRFEGGQLRDAKVALVGCSYAGSMATWMRLAYPHLVDAAFSDSGPLRAQEDFPEYLEVVTEALRSQGGEECLSSVESAMLTMDQMLQTDAGAIQISNMFNTCTNLQATTPLDVATFFWFGITETFAYLVQYATPGDIPAACDVITDHTVVDPVQRLANWITSQPWTQPCIETRYMQVVAAHSNTSYDAPDATNFKQGTLCSTYGDYPRNVGIPTAFNVIRHVAIATSPLMPMEVPAGCAAGLCPRRDAKDGSVGPGWTLTTVIVASAPEWRLITDRRAPIQRVLSLLLERSTVPASMDLPDLRRVRLVPDHHQLAPAFPLVSASRVFPSNVQGLLRAQFRRGVPPVGHRAHEPAVRRSEPPPAAPAPAPAPAGPSGLRRGGPRPLVPRGAQRHARHLPRARLLSARSLSLSGYKAIWQ